MYHPTIPHIEFHHLPKDFIIETIHRDENSYPKAFHKSMFYGMAFTWWKDESGEIMDKGWYYLDGAFNETGPYRSFSSCMYHAIIDHAEIDPINFKF